MTLPYRHFTRLGALLLTHLFSQPAALPAQIQARSTAAGTRGAIVIFAHFADEAPGDTAPAWSEGIFDPQRPGGFSHFYDEMSFGQLTVRGVVAPRRYASSSPASAYLAPGPAGRGDIARFVGEILRQADADIDFSLYDNDGPDGRPDSGDDDGNVDALFLVLASTPANFLQGPATGLAGLGLEQPFVTDDAGADGPIRILGGNGTLQRGRNFTEAVGTMAHEFGHLLGLPDLFDVAFLNRTDDPAPAEDSAGIGIWGLMGWGALGWHRDDGPVPLSAWSRAELGWARIDTIVGAEEEITLQPVAAGGHLFYVPLNDREAYLFEYRTRVSHYDAALPAAGVLIWRLEEVPNEGDRPGFTRVDLECADGRWREAGFPAGITADPSQGGDNLDFWAHDASYAAAHGGNLGDATDPFDGVRFRRFAADTNPSSLSEDGARAIEVDAIRLEDGVARATVRTAAPAVELVRLDIIDEDADGVFFAGEVVSIAPRLRNVGGLDLADLRLELGSDDDAIQILQPQMRFSTLRIGRVTFGAGEEAGFLRLRFRPGLVGETRARLWLRVTARGFDAVVDTLELSGFSPRLPLSAVAILDSAGNGDGAVQRGEFVSPLFSYAARISPVLRQVLRQLDLRVASLDAEHRVVVPQVELGIGVDSVITTRGAEILVGSRTSTPLRLRLTSASPYAEWSDTLVIPLAPGEDETPPRVSFLRARPGHGELALDLPFENILEGGRVAGARAVIYRRTDTTAVKTLPFERQDGGFLALWRDAPTGVFLARAEVDDDRGNTGRSRLQAFSVIGAPQTAGGGNPWSLLPPMPGLVPSGLTSVVTAPGNRQILYGVGGDALWLSYDAGKNWARTGVMTGGNLGPGSIHIDAADPFTLYVSIPRPLISRDGGLTWRQLESGGDRDALYVDPTVSGRLYAIETSALAQQLRRSDDFGDNWQTVGEGWSPLFVNPADPRELYAGRSSTWDPVTGARSPAPIHHSRDGGATWEEIPQSRPLDYAIDPHTPGGLYGTRVDTLFHSRDHGRSWEVRALFTAPWGVRLIVHRSRPGLLYVSSTAAVRRSLDGGVTWSEYGPDRTSTLFPFVWSLQVDPVDPARAFMSATVREGSSNKQVLLRTLDDGETWQPLAGPRAPPQVGTVKMSADGTLIAGSGSAAGPALATAVAGQGWDWVVGETDQPLFSGQGRLNDLYIDPADEDFLLGVFGYTVHSSLDRGRTWRRLEGLFTFREKLVVAPDPQWRGGFYLGGSGLWYTPDRGESLEQRAQFPVDDQGYTVMRTPAGLVVDPEDSQVLLAAIDSSIWRSRDGGRTWDEEYARLGRRILTFEASPLDPAQLVALVGPGGVYRSFDGGATWGQVSEQPVWNYRGGRLRFHPRDPLRMYVVNTFQIYQTRDGGSSWEPVAATLPLLMSFSDVSVDPGDGETLYAATPWGVYRLGDGQPTAVLDADGTAPAAFALGPSFPNPFNLATRIPYRLASAGEVELSLYNAAGQRLRRLVRERLPAGTYVTGWDGRDAAGREVATGLYIARLLVDGRQRLTHKLLLLH